MVCPMDVSARLLEQFVVVAEEEHFGRAAARLSMSQPPLTQAVQRLEREVGTALLERVGRGVRLTPAGVVFAADAAALLVAQDAAAERARRVAAGLEGVVRLGFVGSLSVGFVPDLLRRAGGQVPQVDLRLVQGSSRSLLEQVGRRTLDIAVVRAASVGDSSLAVRHVHRERLLLAVPAGHRLASRRRVRLGDLTHEPFASFGGAGSPELGEPLRAACAEAGFTPRVIAEAVDLPGLLAWVIAGRALALVPAQTADFAGRDIVLHELADHADRLTLDFVAVSRPDPDAAVGRVLDLTVVPRAGAPAR